MSQRESDADLYEDSIGENQQPEPEGDLEQFKAYREANEWPLFTSQPLDSAGFKLTN